MSIEHYDGESLKIYVSENDRHEGRSLYNVLIEKALAAGLSGGSVFRGREGFGAHGEVHTANILRMADNLPVLIEFIGRSEKIEAFMTTVEAIVPEGLVTRRPVQITKLRKT